MSKFDSMKILKPATSKRNQICAICKGVIPAGETYYQERLTDSRISNIGKRYHVACKDTTAEKRSRIEDFK